MSNGIKVLMVDDERQFRATTEKLLSRRGFRTILAESGEEAIEKLGERPDVIILDIKMPGMDGHQALKEIKKILPEIPVIMLTGHGAMPSAREALVEGAFDYLTKPCDIDILAGKITEAYRHGRKEASAEERRVADVMIPISHYTTLSGEETVRTGIAKLRESFTCKVSTSRIMETGHRSILVLGEGGRVEGFLSIADLLEAIMPQYLSVPKPSMADSIQYSPMFWRGMFTREVKALGKKTLREVMSPGLVSVDAGANLVEAAYLMVEKRVRRLVVYQRREVVGVIREQDLFFEMERLLRE